ncbi:MAG: hypothetical protein JWP78_2067 [Mucilaginibacter sp.]|nr:hypothetical protein [Mucilaginibacter sp.]
MEIPAQFFTVESMLTLTGASGATYLICNGLQKAIDFNPKWLALAVAVGLSLVGVYLAKETKVTDYFVGVVNGFLIYATAAGATEAGSKKPDRSSAETTTFGSTADSAPPLPKRTFRSSWFN